MAISVTHAFTSGVADGPDNTLVQPSDWNEAHVVTGALEYVGTPPTKTIGSGGDFATIAAAVSWLYSSQFTNGTVVFTMLDGVHTHDASFGIRGVRPSVQFTAQNTPQVLAGTNFTATQTGGVSGAYDYNLVVTDVTGVSVGDYVVITPTAGTNWQRMGGCFKVTGVNSGTNTISILNTHRNTTFASGTITGTVLRPKAIIKAPTYTGAYLVVQNAAVVLTNMAIVMEASSGTNYPVYVQAGGMISFTGTAAGVYNNSTAGSCVVARNIGYVTFANATKCGVSGQCTLGLDVAEASYISIGGDAASYFCIGGMSQQALYLTSNSTIYQNTAVASAVVINGSGNPISCTQRSYIKLNTLVNTAVSTTNIPATSSDIVGVYDNA